MLAVDVDGEGQEASLGIYPHKVCSEPPTCKSQSALPEEEKTNKHMDSVI